MECRGSPPIIGKSHHMFTGIGHLKQVNIPTKSCLEGAPVGGAPGCYGVLFAIPTIGRWIFTRGAVGFGPLYNHSLCSCPPLSLTQLRVKSNNTTFETLAMQATSKHRPESTSTATATSQPTNDSTKVHVQRRTSPKRVSP